MAEMSLLSRLPLYCGAAVLLAAPFETLNPVLRLAGQRLSNLEIVIAVAVGLWVVGLFSERRPPQVPGLPLLAGLLLVGLMALSALCAPDHQGEALVFMGRVVAGFCLFLLFADIGAQPGWQSWVIRPALAAGGLVAVLGLFEWVSAQQMSGLLSSFQQGPFYAAGLLRVSSTLQYPTIMAMVLEILFVLALAPYLAAVNDRRRLQSGLLLILLLTMGAALILTRTRGGLLAVGVVFFCAWLLIWYRFPRRAAGLKALLLLAVLMGGLWASTFFEGEHAWLRWQSGSPANWFRATYRVPDSLRFQPGETRRVPVTLGNTGVGLWRPGGENPVRLAYHWIEQETGETTVFEGLRTPLPEPVGPGQRVEIMALVLAPSWPGNYCLAWDLVKEHQFWFSAEGNPTPCTAVVVVGVRQVETPPRSEIQFTGSRFSIERGELWRLALSIWKEHPWLGVGPDNFRLTYGPHAGYPVWDRSYHANNLYLEFLSGTGVLGFSGLLAFLAAIGWQLRQRWRQPGGGRQELLAVTLAVVAVLAHGLVDYFFQFTPTYVLTWAVLGLAAAGPPKQPR